MESKRLNFRTLHLDDATRLFEIYSDAEAMKYRQSEPHLTMEDTLEMLERDFLVRISNYEIRYAILDKESQILIGTFMYQPLTKKAIIGYSFAKEYWNKGFASEVVQYFVEHLKSKEYEFLEAWVLKENIPSCKVLEKNGFKKITQTIYPQSQFYQLKL